jgi:hypothetical protein
MPSPVPPAANYLGELQWEPRCPLGDPLPVTLTQKPVRQPRGGSDRMRLAVEELSFASRQIAGAGMLYWAGNEMEMAAML